MKGFFVVCNCHTVTEKQKFPIKQLLQEYLKKKDVNSFPDCIV